MPTIEEHAKNIPKAEKRRRIFILDVAQDHLIIFLSTNVHRRWCCARTSLFYFFPLLSYFFLASHGGGPGWWPRVVAPGGGPGWWPRVVASGGGSGWWPRVVAPGGGPRWWPRVVAPGGGQFKEVVFVLQVTHVLYEWKITTAHPILTNKFKSI